MTEFFVDEMLGYGIYNIGENMEDHSLEKYLEKIVGWDRSIARHIDDIYFNGGLLKIKEYIVYELNDEEHDYTKEIKSDIQDWQMEEFGEYRGDWVLWDNLKINKIDKEKEKIYIVVGETGDFDNYAKFNSAAFKDKNEAIIYMEKLNKQLTNLGISFKPTFLIKNESALTINVALSPTAIIPIPSTMSPS